MDESLNVFGKEMEACSIEPMTGWRRDGCCNTDASDLGLHVVCCIVTDPFLDFLKEHGNDLIEPAPQFGFPGLTAGDSWCVCARSWKQAVDHGAACPVNLEATHLRALEIIPLAVLELHAL